MAKRKKRKTEITEAVDNIKIADEVKVEAAPAAEDGLIEVSKEEIEEPVADAGLVVEEPVKKPESKKEKKVIVKKHVVNVRTSI